MNINCAHFGGQHGSLVQCNNDVDMIHSGYMPASFCDQCIYRKERSNLPTDQQPDMRLHFVWTYWHGGASSDEIRFSVRSVEHFSMSKPAITIVGDRPPWYTGHVIHKPKTKAGDPVADMFSKLHAAALSHDVGEHCVWMMDDVYFVKPFMSSEIMQPRAAKHRPSVQNDWQRRKKQTCEMLRERGYSDWDFATHAPHYFRKSELLDMIVRFQFDKIMWIWEIVYGNVYRQSPEPPSPWLRRITEKISAKDFEMICQPACVVNNSASAWCEGLRKGLVELLPFSASCEEEGAYPNPPSWTQQSFKRRPESIRDRTAYIAEMKQAGFIGSKLIRQ